MNIRRLTPLFAGIGLGMSCAVLPQAAETNTPPASPKLSPQEFQEKLKAMTPEERSSALQAYREQAAREARQRPRVQQPGTNAPPLTPQEIEARQKQIMARLEARVADLEKKKAAGTLAPQEETQLEKLKSMLERGPAAFSANGRRQELRPPDPAPKTAKPQTNPPPPGPQAPRGPEPP